MTTFQQLKHEARKAEQRSDWRKAIALYREAMRYDEQQHGSAELGLFNRIGDLHIRLGEVPQAVECYEQAADRYECHRWSVEQTGFDPSQPGGNVQEEQHQGKRLEYQRGMKACLEALNYSVQ